MVKSRRCVLTYARQTSEATLQVHVDSDWAEDLLGRRGNDRGDFQTRQTLAETHVMLANASCFIQAETLSTTL